MQEDACLVGTQWIMASFPRELLGQCVSELRDCPLLWPQLMLPFDIFLEGLRGVHWAFGSAYVGCKLTCVRHAHTFVYICMVHTLRGGCITQCMQ